MVLYFHNRTDWSTISHKLWVTERILKILLTRMHSSRMHTTRTVTIGGAVCSGGGVCSRGDLLPRECLLPGVSAPRGGLLRGVCSQGGSAPSGGGGWLLPEEGGVPCDISHHAFDVTCMLPPHQLRHINSAPAYILLPGYVTCKACWDTPPPCGQTHTCKNITFANYVCGW